MPFCVNFFGKRKRRRLYDFAGPYHSNITFLFQFSMAEMISMRDFTIETYYHFSGDFYIFDLTWIIYWESSACFFDLAFDSGFL